jgi:osmoprotectant transport system permease protein
MGFGDYLYSHLSNLLLDSFQHVSAVIQSIVLATVIGVLVGIAVYRGPIGSAVATALTSAILTIPSFALIGVLIPVLGLGVKPTITALVLYALLPIVRNTIVGLDNIDPAITSAAQGIGMNRSRVLTQMLMGIAAIAAYAKGPGLGVHIFSGLSQIGSANAINNVAAGTLGIVILALILDGIYVLIGRLTISRGIRDTDS